MYELKNSADGFSITLDGRELLRHQPDRPCLFIGRGEADIKMFRGNFDIKDCLVEKIALTDWNVEKVSDGWQIKLSRTDVAEAILHVTTEEGRLKMTIAGAKDGTNRFWLNLEADPQEKIYGCGEQFSYFNLRGRNFPLWTSEQGVGRNKKTLVTWQADCQENAGGDYYWTFYPQPTFVSTKKYYCHIVNTSYMDFDFSKSDRHELAIWDKDVTLLFETGETYIELVRKLTDLLGRQPEMPDWVYEGMILGIQGGTATCLEKTQKMLDNGVKVAGIWAQDWEGRRITSFGKRLMWNWRWDEELYPGLDQEIKNLKARGIRFMGYINPYVAIEKELYAEAAEKGYLAKNAQRADYQVEFGEFYAGVVDFTNPEAFAWYKEVIKKNLIDFGLDGWMADFGEYLPTDTILHNGVSAEIMHNAWPVLWAQCNYEAIKEAGKLGEILYFMRAGYSGSQKYSVMMWAGDQNVDWSLDDGLASVIPSALSLAMSGHGLHHSDIGGYTTLFGMKRSKELLLRWTDFAAFTPLMRTHEGNRPDDNWQFDSDEETMKHFARMTDVHVKLAPYLKEQVRLNAMEGLPVMRPLFMHYEQDEQAYDIAYQYLLGRDLLVAPIHEEGATTWQVYLPEDEWVELWTGKKYTGGNVTVDGSLGCPPVFYRVASTWSKLFAEIGDL